MNLLGTLLICNDLRCFDSFSVGGTALRCALLLCEFVWSSFEHCVA